MGIYVNMPDGFDPHVELQRITNLRDMMHACRERTPKVLAIIDDVLDNPEVSYETKLKASEMLWNRGYGKPIQQVRIMDHNQKAESPVRIVLPDNGRDNIKGQIIDAT